jgi:hypothetical protein
VGLGALESQENLLPNNVALHICILIEGPTTVAHTQTRNQLVGAVAGIRTQMGSGLLEPIQYERDKSARTGCFGFISQNTHPTSLILAKKGFWWGRIGLNLRLSLTIQPCGKSPVYL